MPEYKKRKKRRQIKWQTKKENNFDTKTKNDDFDIKMTQNNKNGRPQKENKGINVIKGKKPKRKLKLKTIFVSLVVLLLIFVISLFAFPVGILETINNLIVPIRVGNYPIELYGTQIVDTKCQNNYFFALTNTQIYSVSDSGKVIFTESHGFSKPVIKSSKTRALVYGQSENTYNIFTVKGLKLSSKLDDEIITADVSDSGTYAIATFSSEYTSSVFVFDKSGEKIFTWNCAKDLINNVVLSENGKKIAISTLNAINGEITSNVYLFDLKKTDAQNTFEYKNESINSLQSSNKGFFVIAKNRYDFISWRKGEKTENTTQKECNTFCIGKSRSIIVLNRESNRSDNTIVCFNKTGKELSKFELDGNITDIKISGSHIYCISDSQILIYDTAGNLICSEVCGYEYKRIIPLGSYSVSVVSDNQIKKFSLN